MLERAGKINERIDSRSHSLFRPFDPQKGFGIQGATKMFFEAACFVLAMPLRGAKAALSDLAKKRKDV